MEYPELTGEKALAFIFVVWPAMLVLVATAVYVLFLHG